MKNLKIFIYFTILLFVANLAKTCPECEVPGASPASFSMAPTSSLYVVNLASAGSEALALVAIEDEEDITTLSDTGSLTLRESRGLSRIKKRNLYKKSIQGISGFELGDWVDLPARKVEVAPLKENIANTKGYVLKVYSHLEQGKFENNHLVFEIEVVGGYKRNLNDATYIPESDVKNGDIYLVEAKKITTDGVIKGINKVYRYFKKAEEPIDNWWYYERNGVKTKAEKIIQKQSNDAFLVTKRIYSKNAIDETSEIKIKESVKDSERVVKNGRIFRGKHLSQAAGKYTSKMASTSKTTLDANGNVFGKKSEANSFYLDDSGDYQKGKVRTKTNKDGTITLFEYHPTLDGNFRTYTMAKGVELKDVSGDGSIGIEDLQNTPVIVEEKESIDWQGSRHSKSLINKKAKASFSATTNANGYKVVLSDEKILSKDEYAHKRTESGGVIEEISTYKLASDGELQLANVSAFEFESLSLGEPVARYNILNPSEENQVGKIIEVLDGGSIGFSASGFLNGTVPNYANAPRFDSTANTYYSNFRLTGIESETSSTISLPWGGTYTANGFALVSGKSTLEVELTLDYSGTALYEATYVYIDGVFYLGEWTYYNRDMSDYDLRGTYRHNNTYSTQTALDSNNIRSFTDFNGSEYQIGYSDSTESVEIFRRDIGVASNEYGNQYDKITVYTKNLEDGSCASCGDAPEEYGQKAVSYFVSSQIGGYGGVNSNGGDTLLYQTYEYSLVGGIKTLEVDKYGIVIRREYTDNNDGTYTLKEIRPGFSSEEPYFTRTANKEDNSTISFTGAGVVNEYHTKTSNGKIVEYGYVGSGRTVEYIYDDAGNIISETTPLGTTSYSYNDHGFVTAITNPKGSVVNYTYDAFNLSVLENKTGDNGDNIELSSYNYYYTVENNVVWSVVNKTIDGTYYTIKYRISPFVNDVDNGNPVIEHSEVIYDGYKLTSISSLDRNAKKIFSKDRYYYYSGSEYELIKQNNYIALNSKTIEESELNDDDELRIRYTYDSFGNISDEVYYKNNLLTYNIKRFYQDPEQLEILDETLTSRSFKAMGRLESISCFNGNEKMGRIMQYVPRGEKNAGKLKSYTVSTSFDLDNKPIDGYSSYYDYNDMGDVYRAWGYGQIPTILLYDDFGMLKNMYLFKDIPNNASQFTTSQWPSVYNVTHSSAEATTWAYDAQTGLLLSKVDSLGKTTQATYNSFGEMVSLTDPNGNIMSWTYDINGNILSEQVASSQSGSINFTYSDGILTQVNAEGGGYVYTYGNDSKLVPLSENMQENYKLERTLNENGDVVEVRLLDPENNEVYSVNYSYDGLGRLKNMVADGKTMTYERAPSGEISEINLNGVSKITYEYDNIKRIKSIGYVNGSTEIMKDSYSYSANGKIDSVLLRRNNIDYANWSYEYHVSQPGLKKALLFKGATKTELFDAYSQSEFEYDLAGNVYRVKRDSIDDWTEYTNSLANQVVLVDYASDVTYPIRGKTPEDASLNIRSDGILSTNILRDSVDFLYPAMAHTQQRKYSDIEIESILPQTGENELDAKTLQIGKIYIPQTPEILNYDNNGNLINDSRWNYTWDHKNRLISLETNDAAILAGVPREKYVYVYDYLDRKIKSLYYKYESSQWELVSTNKRFYDNWNLIYEITEYEDGSSQSIVNKYYYGLDVLDEIYGTGGTGGVRMMNLSGQNVFPFNNILGNVEALFDSENAGAVLVEYQYDAFGKLFYTNGDLAMKNPLTFSTRYLEQNTGLYYYGYRHYSPRVMKWISKEPLGENENLNLFNIVLNDPINFFDVMGLYLNANAVRDAIKKANGERQPFHKKSKEMCGRICEHCVTKQLRATIKEGQFVRQSKEHGSDFGWCRVWESPKCNKDEREVGSWHTHGSSKNNTGGKNESFSENDYDFYQNPEGKSNPNNPDIEHYLITPTNVLKRTSAADGWGEVNLGQFDSSYR